MRSVFFSRMTRLAAVSLLVVLLVVPSASAAQEPNDPTLWAEFLAWVEGGFGAENGVGPDDAGFIVWFMSRVTVPGG